MLAGYAYALQAAGFAITGPARGSLLARPVSRHATLGREAARQAHSEQVPGNPAARQAPGQAATGSGRPPHPRAGQLARELQTGPHASGPPAEQTPPGPENPPALLPPGGTPAPQQQEPRHCGQRASDGTNDARTIPPGQVPARGEDLPHSAVDRPGHLATGADRRAGPGFRPPDPGRTSFLAPSAPVRDPGRQPGKDERGTQTGAYAATAPARPVTPETGKAPCPQCGHRYAQPAGEPCPCLSCHTQARLKTAGFTADSPGIKQITGWNHAVIHQRDGQPETPPQPEPDPHNAALPGEAFPEREKEACG
jgi:hypothetical protein